MMAVNPAILTGGRTPQRVDSNNQRSMANELIKSRQIANEAGATQNRLYTLAGGDDAALARMQQQEAAAAQTSQQQISQAKQDALKKAALWTSGLDDPAQIAEVLSVVAGVADGDPLVSRMAQSLQARLESGGVEAYRAAIAPVIGMTAEKQPEQPAAVREYEFFRSLPESEREPYLNLKRNGFKLVTDSRGGMSWQNPQTGEAFQVESPDAALAGAGEKARTTAAASEQGKGEQQRTQTSINQGLAAADSMPVYKRGLELLREVSTGGIDRVRLAAKQEFGIESADEAELVAGLGKAVLSQLRTTFGAQFTEQEGARLERIEANIGKSTAGNIRLLEQALAISKRAAERGITAAEANGDFETANMIEEAMNWDISSEYGGGAGPQIQEGATATNPQTGERLVYRNGQWVPAQ